MPTLALLSEHPEGLHTSAIIQQLENRLELSPEDSERNPSRDDSRFSQIVRNLVSHKTMIQKGLVQYGAEDRDRVHIITRLGEEYLIRHADEFEFVSQNGFLPEDRESVIVKDFSDLVIEEGFTRIVQNTERSRSRKLVQMARAHYAVGNKVYCTACAFNFEDFYGEVGRGFIEIHHLRPIFAYEGSLQQDLETALENVRPLCANCHRMVHRKRNSIMEIGRLRSIIEENGTFEILKSL